MNEFLASIDRKKLMINVAGYLIITGLFFAGPGMGGFVGGVIRVYIWFFPIYYLAYLFVLYRKNRGGKT